MDNLKSVVSLGIMCGSSLDGAKFSLIRTDGVDIFKVYKSCKFLYPEELKVQIRELVSAHNPEDERLAGVNEEFTKFIAASFSEFKEDIDENIDIIGFEGNTVSFDIENQNIMQIGDPQAIANATKVRTVAKFRTNDMKLGGQGAPISPTFYAAVSSEMKKPLVFINIGGSSLLTYLGELGEMISFDCGTGNNIINEYMKKHACMDMDYDGKCAISGTVHEKIVQSMLKNKYLQKMPPKVAPFGMFDAKAEHLEGLSCNDGAATVTDFVASSISSQIRDFLPHIPEKIIVSGGGVKNPTLLRFLRKKLPESEVLPAEELGLDSQSLVTQARAFLAVRRLYNMPITFPSTTGAVYPAIGGKIYSPEE